MDTGIRCSLALLLLAAVAAAQEPESGESTEVRRYSVEVIIFRYADDVSVGTEIFEPDVPPAPAPVARAERQRMSGAVAARPAANGSVAADVAVDAGAKQPRDDTAEEEPTDDTRPAEFILHLEDELTLIDTAERLERLDVYEPIMHFAWTQTTKPREDARPIELPALARPSDGLSGSFMLYQSRYLHLVVDLTLEDRATLAERGTIDEPALTFGDGRTGPGYADAERPPVRFRIQEDRIFKDGDLRYFDHPKFGALVRINRIEDEGDEAEPALPGDDPRELLGRLGR